MKVARIAVALVAVVVLAAATMGAFHPDSAWAFAPALQAVTLAGTSALTLAMPGMVIVPKTRDELEEAANANGAELEAVPWAWYDTQTYTDNTTVEMRLFSTQSNDRSITNLPQAGQLPYFFELHYIAIDVVPTAATAWVTTAAGGVAGILDDLGMLLVSGRGYLTLTVNSKPYGTFPLQGFHGTGGPNGGGWGTFTAEESLQFANNGVPDGSFIQFRGTKTIRPRDPIELVIRWPAAVNLTADYRIRAHLVGVSHQPVG